MNTEDNSNKKSGNHSIWADVRLFLPIAGSAIVVLVVYGFAVRCLTNAPAEAGLFGDSFGGANALFSALAFAAVYVALRLQRLELEEQRKELRETRIYIKSQADTLSLQRFETTFFSMIRSYSDFVSKIRYSGRSGREALQTDFVGFRDTLKNKVNSARSRSKNLAPVNLEFRNGISKYFKSVEESEIAVVARQLESILTFVDRSAISEVEKQTYVTVFSDSITTCELGFLFFLAQLDEKHALNELLQKYGFLANMPNQLTRDWEDINRLGSGAFSRGT